MDSPAPPPGDAPVTPAPAARKRRWLVALGLAAALAGGVWAALGWQRRPPAAEEFASPFLNTHPGVAYVGSARCAECHAEQAASFAHHPMGRSVSGGGHWLPEQPRATPSFEADGLHYAVE